jgi:SAM-dependent methyltransferase
MIVPDKYDRLADGFADDEYADSAYYNARRAEAVFSIGPSLPTGAAVLDLACGDASFAEEVLARGYRYVGVDASRGMREAAVRRIGNRGTIEPGDFMTYEPSASVDASVVLRSMYLLEDRVAFLRRVGEYTRTKIVFDVSSRQIPIGRMATEARLAGFDRFEMRPFFVSLRYVPPRPVDHALRALERSGPLARAIASRRFRVFCAAYRST